VNMAKIKGTHNAMRVSGFGFPVGRAQRVARVQHAPGRIRRGDVRGDGHDAEGEGAVDVEAS
jgi:hypothetical protein